jgi:predicted RecB family nuclease
VEWVGEVTNVSTLTRGSLELYGEELMSDLLVVDNISPLKVRKLEGIGIRSRADLLRIGRSQLGRQDIARRTGIGVRQLTDWLNKADLMRIDGLTMTMIRLLEVAGIETIEDLAVARPEAIQRKLQEFSKRQSPNLQLPDQGDLNRWVEAANQLVS